MKEMLPKKPAEIVNGGLYHQAVRCGKPSCRCARGELHQGYYYFFTRVDRRLKKVYVPKHLVQVMAALSTEAASLRKAARLTVAESMDSLRDFRCRLRDMEAAVSLEK